MKDRRELYEKFHFSTSRQPKILKKNNFTYRNIFALIDKFVDSKAKVVDVGCGSGSVSFYLAKRGNNVLGVDISKNAIDACNESSQILGFNEQRISFKVLDFPREKIKTHTDVVILSEVIEHIEDDHKALRDIFNILSDNGILIITTPSKNAPLHKLNLLSNFDKRVGHVRRYDIEDLYNLARQASFDVIYVNKMEGILRNFLFTNDYAGNIVRLIKFQISDVVTFFDNLLIPLFGESNIAVVLKKSK